MQRWAWSWLGFLFSSACPLGVGSWWRFEKKQVKEAWLGEGRLGTYSHNKDRLCMEFVSLEIWVSSFSMFFDSFPQLAVRYLLNLATALHRECQVWGLQALSLLPCLYMEAHMLCTHARAGTSSPWAHTRLCMGDTCLSVCTQRRRLAPVHGRAPVGSEAQAPASTSVSITVATGTGTAVTDPSYMLQTDFPTPGPHDEGDKSLYVFCAPGPKSLHTHQVYCVHK